MTMIMMTIVKMIIKKVTMMMMITKVTARTAEAESVTTTAK